MAFGHLTDFVAKMTNYGCERYYSRKKLNSIILFLVLVQIYRTRILPKRGTPRQLHKLK